MRILRPAGKLEQLTHAMNRYHWNIVGLCEMRWKNFGEVSTDDGHKIYFSGEEDRHEYGVGFLVHKDVLGCCLRMPAKHPWPSQTIQKMDMAQLRWETPNQIDYILVKKRFRSGVNIHRTRSFPGADIGSDYDLVMMTFRVRLKKARKPNQPRLRFDFEKLSDPDVACTFQATVGGKFTLLIGLSDEDMDINTMITTYNTVVTDAASEILRKERRR